MDPRGATDSHKIFPSSPTSAAYASTGVTSTPCSGLQKRCSAADPEPLRLKHQAVGHAEKIAPEMNAERNRPSVFCHRPHVNGVDERRRAGADGSTGENV